MVSLHPESGDPSNCWVLSYVPVEEARASPRFLRDWADGHQWLWEELSSSAAEGPGSIYHRQ